MRFHIEQAFGIMTGRRLILCQPLQICLKNVGKLLMCITRLHNFCIDEGKTSLNGIENNQGGYRG